LWVSGASVLTGYLGWLWLQPARYSLDGGCIEYDWTQTETHGGGVLSASKVPSFVITYTATSPELKDTQFNISAWFHLGLMTRDEAAAGYKDADNSLCARSKSDFGLYITEDSGSRECQAMSARVTYTPIEDSEQFNTVSISCDISTSVPNCRLFDYYEDRISATVVVPKLLLPEWQQISKVVRAYTKQNLKPCEDQSESYVN
jgi:hypothetical protein